MEESISKNEKIREKFELLSVDCPMELVAQWAAKEQASERDYEKVASLLDGIKMLRDRNNCKMLRNMSGLPKVSRRTFDNFDVSRLSSANKDMFEHLKSLSFLDTGFNVVIIGDPGTGKTHIAQAIGNLCCDKLYSTRYYKMAELEKKLKKAIENDKASSLLENLSKVSCLIIDEVGHCDPLNGRESNLFFQILDNRYNKGKGSTVFTSNMKPSEWRPLFFNASVARCALDRIMDRCIAIDIRGASYRGQQKKVFKISTSSVPEVTGLNLYQ